jgi:hypothetical protein
MKGYFRQLSIDYKGWHTHSELRVGHEDGVMVRYLGFETQGFRANDVFLDLASRRLLNTYGSL